MSLLVNLLTIIFGLLIAPSAQQTTYDENIKFLVTTSDGTTFTSSFSYARQNFIDRGCNPEEPLTIVIHGWKESCSKNWAVEAVSKFRTHRGGCTICMDWSAYITKDQMNYVEIISSHYHGITDTLAKFIRQMDTAGFSPSDHLLIFGFSLGAIWSFEGAYKYGKVWRIDACEPPSAMIDETNVYKRANTSAMNVQCFHTSSNLGTKSRMCHQDWEMGKCGEQQAAAGKSPLFEINHVLCCVFYNSAFENDFEAIPNPYPNDCPRNKSELIEVSANETVLMGYRFAQYSKRGIAYANTATTPPYNVL